MGMNPNRILLIKTHSTKRVKFIFLRWYLIFKKRTLAHRHVTPPESFVSTDPTSSVHDNECIPFADLLASESRTASSSNPPDAPASQPKRLPSRDTASFDTLIPLLHPPIFIRMNHIRTPSLRCEYVTMRSNLCYLMFAKLDPPSQLAVQHDQFSRQAQPGLPRLNSAIPFRQETPACIH